MPSNARAAVQWTRALRQGDVARDCFRAKRCAPRLPVQRRIAVNKKYFVASVSLRAARIARQRRTWITPTPEQVAPHMARFLDMLDSAFRRYRRAGRPAGTVPRRGDRDTPVHVRSPL